MLVYVVVQLVEDFESEATKPDSHEMMAPARVSTYEYIIPSFKEDKKECGA